MARYGLDYCRDDAPRGMAAVIDTARGRGNGEPIAFVWPGHADWLLARLNVEPRTAPPATRRRSAVDILAEFPADGPGPRDPVERSVWKAYTFAERYGTRQPRRANYGAIRDPRESRPEGPEAGIPSQGERLTAIQQRWNDAAPECPHCEHPQRDHFSAVGTCSHRDCPCEGWRPEAAPLSDDAGRLQGTPGNDPQSPDGFWAVGRPPGACCCETPQTCEINAGGCDEPGFRCRLR